MRITSGRRALVLRGLTPRDVTYTISERLPYERSVSGNCTSTPETGDGMSDAPSMRELLGDDAPSNWGR